MLAFVSLVILIAFVVMIVKVNSGDSSEDLLERIRQHFDKTLSDAEKEAFPMDFRKQHSPNGIRCKEENAETIVNPKYKADRVVFGNYIRTNNVRCLYHFTDRANLPLIIKHGGLYSWRELEARNIQVVKSGGNKLSRNLDVIKGLEDYVRLSFTKEHPMRYVAQGDGRINDIIFLEIDPEVIYWQETLLSDKNATSNSARIGKNFKDFKLIDFDLIRRGSWASEQEKASFQAEVMVKTHIPLRYCLNQSSFMNI